MNPTVAIRQCFEYNPHEIADHIDWLYTAANGPDPSGKRILVKPNISADEDTERPVTTHPVVVEAVIKYLQSRGAVVFVGDSPTIDTDKYTGRKSGIRQVVESCGATWVRFNGPAVSRKVGNFMVKITSLIEEVDLIISLSKMKNHELMYFTGAMKNIFGLVPAFNKALQHARYPDRYHMAEFFVDLEEAIKPDFHIMDGIVAMEGPGPGSGYPKKANVLLASVNPLALDIIACRILGYSPEKIPVNAIALTRGRLLKSADDIVVTGADPRTLVIHDFKRIITPSGSGIVFKYFQGKFPVLRKLDKRPVFLSHLCISCANCIRICPYKALRFDSKNRNRVLLDDPKCIRCYCCQEVCMERAIEIKRKVF
jgi:uncharacterized protein (DUF362 family)/NAD-dependent dihydropyrimidine dehydrogenase PreA subunit